MLGIRIYLLLLSSIIYAQSDLDRYYQLKRDVEKLRADFKDNQESISKINTSLNFLMSPSTTKDSINRLQDDNNKILKEIRPKVEEIRVLGQTLKVNAWVYWFGALKQMNVVLERVAERRICSNGRYQFFSMIIYLRDGIMRSLIWIKR